MPSETNERALEQFEDALWRLKQAMAQYEPAERLDRLKALTQLASQLNVAELERLATDLRKVADTAH